MTDRDARSLPSSETSVCDVSITVSAPAADFCSRRQETIAYQVVPMTSCW